MLLAGVIFHLLALMTCHTFMLYISFKEKDMGFLKI
jgi:hypothetical protein